MGPDIQSQTFLYPIFVNLGFISGYYLGIQKTQGLLSESSICLGLRFRIRLIVFIHMITQELYETVQCQKLDVTKYVMI